jgi:hypothetical protein
VIGLLQAALAILKVNWKYLAIGILVASTYTYIQYLQWRVDHWKKEVQTVSEAFDAYKHESERRRASLAASSQEITERFERSNQEKLALLTQNQKLTNERIKLAKELADVKLSAAAVQLFNDSTNPGHSAPEAKQGNDEVASRSEAPAVAEKPLTQELSMLDLLTTSTENNTNHWACVFQVESWQKFWLEYEESVKNATH